MLLIGIFVLFATILVMVIAFIATLFLFDGTVTWFGAKEQQTADPRRRENRAIPGHQRSVRDLSPIAEHRRHDQWSHVRPSVEDLRHRQPEEPRRRPEHVRPALVETSAASAELGQQIAVRRQPHVSEVDLISPPRKVQVVAPAVNMMAPTATVFRIPSMGSTNAGDVVDIAMADAQATPLSVQHGYASKLAQHFGGTSKAHLENVGEVVNAFGLGPMDICYCFLCLERVASSPGGEDLQVKGHGVGPYAARVWVVALARFVRVAQFDSGACDEERIAPLCEKWQYVLERFLGLVHSCEVPFQRKHGRALFEAFKQDSIRNMELLRAQSALAALGAAGPRGADIVRNSTQALPASKTLKAIENVSAGTKRPALENGAADGEVGGVQKKAKTSATKGSTNAPASKTQASAAAKKKGKR